VSAYIRTKLTSHGFLANLQTQFAIGRDLDAEAFETGPYRVSLLDRDGNMKPAM
jgi:hypothetical protein